jgi:cell division transport system permease protein
MAKQQGSHRWITFLRILKTGGQNFIRNAWLSIAAIAVMIITLGIILFSIIANAAFNNTINQLTDKIDISVYLKDSVDEERRNELINEVKSIPNVKSVEYVSKDQALEDFKEDNENDIDLLLAVSQADNELPASLRIKPHDVNKIEDIKAFVERPEIKELQAEETSYSGTRKDAIDNITRTTKLLQRLGLLAVIVFAIVSVLIIFNTIQMAIFNRRDELQIMRLLGASTWYIRGPFIVETVLYGVVSAIVSVSICNSLFVLASSTLDANSLGLLDINYANDYFNKRFWLILTMQLGIGILIGAASSFVATRRYLKFKTSK